MGNTQSLTRKEAHEIMDAGKPFMFYPILPSRAHGLYDEYIHDVGNLAPTESFVGRYGEFQIMEIGRSGVECIYVCRFNAMDTVKQPVFVVLERHHSDVANRVRAITAFQETWANTPKIAARMITLHYYVGEEFHYVYKITST